MVALLGGSYQMRGYYEGQYRDNDLIQTQVELRQHIYNRHGIALWGGAGNVFRNSSTSNGRKRCLLTASATGGNSRNG